ncbi:hypothetical protein Tco_0931325 [Tanacetum coccineum]
MKIRITPESKTPMPKQSQKRDISNDTGWTPATSRHMNETGDPKGSFKCYFQAASKDRRDRRDDLVRQISQFPYKELKHSDATRHQKGGNGRKRQAPSHLDDSTMGEGRKAKGRLEFLSRDNNLFSVIRRGKTNGRPIDLARAEEYEGALRTPDIRGRRCVLKSSIRTLLSRGSGQSKSQVSTVLTKQSLIGFSRETIWPIGQISLLVKIGDEDHSTSAWMNFMVYQSPQHNGNNSQDQRAYEYESLP